MSMQDLDRLYIRMKIAQLTERKGVSYCQMSLDLGHGKNYIQQITAGHSLPPVIELLAICRYFEVSAMDFFNTEKDNPMSEFSEAKLAALSANKE